MRESAVMISSTMAEVDNGGNLGGVSRLLGRAVLDQFYADQEPLAAHVAEDLVAHQAA